MNPISSTPAATPPTLVGWDVGGAHLKAAWLDVDGRLARVVQLACPLWLGMDQLAIACAALFAELPPGPCAHVITMTGEMADFFPDRAHGVGAIADFLADLLIGKRGETMRVFASDAGFVEHAAAREHAEQIASANWIATAQWCARQSPHGLLVDIGSTTTDLIPFAGGAVRAIGQTDAGRLDHGELAYVGIVRTPLMGLGELAPFGGRWRATIPEYYATTADVFRILGELDERCDVQATADNGPKTVEASARRMLRGVGEDLNARTRVAAPALARWYRERVLDTVMAAIALRASQGDLADDAPLVAAGIGRFLVDEIARRLGRHSVAIDDILCLPDTDAQTREWAAHCAPAVAVARLASAQI